MQIGGIVGEVFGGVRSRSLVVVWFDVCRNVCRLLVGEYRFSFSKILIVFRLKALKSSQVIFIRSQVFL